MVGTQDNRTQFFLGLLQQLVHTSRIAEIATRIEDVTQDYGDSSIILAVGESLPQRAVLRVNVADQNVIAHAQLTSTSLIS